MELTKNLFKILIAVLFIMAIIFLKIWLVTKGISMILGVPVSVFPVALIVLGLDISIGGSND